MTAWSAAKAIYSEGGTLLIIAPCWVFQVRVTSPAGDRSNRCRFAVAARRRSTLLHRCRMSFTCRYDNVIQPSIGVPDINRDVFSIIMHIAFCQRQYAGNRRPVLILGRSSNSVIAITPGDL